MKLRWFLLGASLVTAAFLVMALPADAHQCSSGSAGACGPCGGGSHQHADPTYTCQSPGLEVVGLAAGMALAALARRRPGS